MSAMDWHQRHLAPSGSGGIARAVRDGAFWILVVDDEQVVRELLQRFLSLEGYRVMCAEDGLEALQLFNRNPGMFKAVILDILMPRMNGSELFAGIRKLAPTLGIIVMSGFAPEERLEGMIGEPYTTFIGKPFVLGDMLMKVEELVGRDPRPRSSWLTESTSEVPRLEGITD